MPPSSCPSSRGVGIRPIGGGAMSECGRRSRLQRVRHTRRGGHVAGFVREVVHDGTVPVRCATNDVVRGLVTAAEPEIAVVVSLFEILLCAFHHATRSVGLEALSLLFLLQLMLPQLKIIEFDASPSFVKGALRFGKRPRRIRDAAITQEIEIRWLLLPWVRSRRHLAPKIERDSK